MAAVEANEKTELVGDVSEAAPAEEKLKTPKVEEEVNDEDKELLESLKTKPLSFFSKMKDLPEVIAVKYHKDIKRRWAEAENWVKPMEDRMIALDCPEKSLEEDRFEIMGELLDKACQAFEIFDEHENRRIPTGHRIVLEYRLLDVLEHCFGILNKICAEFDKLKGDRDGSLNEREWLRYEIRRCDAIFTEVHERFLKSYLEMEW
ncbi:hypothetical protein QR680_006111 [Steinernema hermaphroditum]|uniref:Uncharacterized protein n=1 Tax=Steinernema hermaphroditum TaxID=289476 RepID=A0AA39LWJ5_9BILA|nr:hypothetical protein QR680_006111 [Steinernema hermaphroditum]